MKILHIPQKGIGLKKAIGGIKTVLLEEVKWENKIEKFESRILVCDKLEEKNDLFINSETVKKDLLEYNPDFVIFDGFWTIEHFYIGKFLKKQNIKYFIKPHGAFNKISQRNSKFKFLKKLIARLFYFNKFVKNSDGLIFLNKLERENSIYRKNVEFLLPNGIEKPNVENTKEKDMYFNISFVFLGRIDIIHKGLNILLDTLLLNKEYFIKNKIIFKFYGDGRKKDVDIFFNYLGKISEIAKYNGTVYGDEKYKVLSNNDIFILTSNFEGMPMGILESLVVGTPCFITKETGMGEYIEKYNAGWVNKKRENLFEDLKKCIELYREKRKEYERNSINCSKKFYWSELLDEYEKKYFEI